MYVYKFKSGYLECLVLFCVLVWFYLFKNYLVGDLVEFLEIYGIFMWVGKYLIGVIEKEKFILLCVLVVFGYNVVGIIFFGMELDFLNVVQGDLVVFQLMIEWCE